MERESLLVTLIVLLGGMALQVFSMWPTRGRTGSAPRKLERRAWLALWWPTAPALTVAAWLCGWALSQPDPVPDHVGWLIFVAAAPFTLVGGRALLRAAWSVCRQPQYAIVTIGLIAPRIVVAPALARALDERAMQAALVHEQAHVRHRDPLRIWLAQIVTDLQWPWLPAQRRFDDWLAALELARDDEARSHGVEGADLAAALLGSVRFQQGHPPTAATLIGQRHALPARVARLLQPLPESQPDNSRSFLIVAGSLGAAWLVAIGLGLICGERLIGYLLALSR